MQLNYLSLATRDIFKHLKSTITQGDAIAFVGAGLSVRAGFADWDELLDRLSKNREPRHRQALATEDLSWWADKARDELGDTEYQHLLKQHFGRVPKRDPAIDSFAKLKFRQVFTTNYDRSIEAAMRREYGRSFRTINWQRPDGASAVLHSFQSSDPRNRHLVYLHGRYNDPARLVLSERDYRDTYVRSDETFRKLFAVFSFRPVVFFGFSLRDLDVLSIFRQVFAATRRARHFAVLPNSNDSAQLRLRYSARYGIQPVFYEPGGDDHPNFARLIDELADIPSKKPTPSKAAAKGTWASRPDFRLLKGQADPEDPQKGRFGGKAEVNGRKLMANVKLDVDSPGWFVIKLEIVTTSGKKLQGKVDLWVHDTFPQEHYYTFARNGIARFTFSAFGAFTVGATCDRGKTALELDLARIKGAPRAFRET